MPKTQVGMLMETLVNLAADNRGNGDAFKTSRQLCENLTAVLNNAETLLRKVRFFFLLANSSSSTAAAAVPNPRCWDSSFVVLSPPSGVPEIAYSCTIVLWL